MKTLLHTLSFLITTGYVAAETAELAGARLPAIVNAPNAVMALSVVTLLAVMAADYGRSARVAPVARATATPVAAAAVATLAGGRAGRRHAYSIRRGAEAARLATPPAVTVFRRTPRLLAERAA